MLRRVYIHTVRPADPPENYAGLRYAFANRLYVGFHRMAMPQTVMSSRMICVGNVGYEAMNELLMRTWGRSGETIAEWGFRNGFRVYSAPASNGMAELKLYRP